MLSPHAAGLWSIFARLTLLAVLALPAELLAILLARVAIFPRPIAFGLGLEAGLLSSYPTMRLIARANGSTLGFGTWAAITLLPAALGITILLVV